MPQPQVIYPAVLYGGELLLVEAFRAVICGAHPR